MSYRCLHTHARMHTHTHTHTLACTHGDTYTHTLTHMHACTRKQQRETERKRKQRNRKQNGRQPEKERHKQTKTKERETDTKQPICTKFCKSILVFSSLISLLSAKGWARADDELGWANSGWLQPIWRRMELMLSLLLTSDVDGDAWKEFRAGPGVKNRNVQWKCINVTQHICRAYKLCTILKKQTKKHEYDYVQCLKCLKHQGHHWTHRN